MAQDAIWGASGAPLGCLLGAHLGAKMGQDGTKWANLAPSWRQDAPQQASKWSPRCVPNRILGHLGAKRVAHELKSAPGVSIFTDFPPILDQIQFNFQPLARHGGGLARAAHWISAAPAERWSGVCGSGVQSCQFQFSNSTNWFQGGLAPVARGTGSHRRDHRSFTFST